MKSLSKEMIERIQRMANMTWDVIGGDVLTVLEEAGEEPVMKRNEVVETVCDASYMLTHGGDKEAYNAWDKLPYKEKTKIVTGAFPFTRYGW